MMLRPALPCSPVIFLSIDYERYTIGVALREGIEWRIVDTMFRRGGEFVQQKRAMK